LEEARPCADPGVVHQQADPRMALENGGGDPVDGFAVGDVEELVLAADLLGERAQPVLAPREQDAAPTVLREQPRRRLADPGRGARDHRYAWLGHRASLVVALAVRPAASTTVARTARRPLPCPRGE